MTEEKSPKVVALSIVVHGLTWSRETIKLLHCPVSGISYDVVTRQENRFQ